ncbi:hypothetical protein PR048_002842 [Dryococelus australis]|uniref:Uncharacterized protein n=1 Tax=Dryococelus australis TaxID=614101 RepID=A0ABQ9ILB5_9NEOP|nr:hypothetical protein PR048_002842 [Dryococelus australis]
MCSECAGESYLNWNIPDSEDKDNIEGNCDIEDHVEAKRTIASIREYYLCGSQPPGRHEPEEEGKEENNGEKQGESRCQTASVVPLVFSLRDMGQRTSSNKLKTFAWPGEWDAGTANWKQRSEWLPAATLKWRLLQSIRATSNIYEALLKFYFQDIRPPRAKKRTYRRRKINRACALSSLRRCISGRVVVTSHVLYFVGLAGRVAEPAVRTMWRTCNWDVCSEFTASSICTRHVPLRSFLSMSFPRTSSLATNEGESRENLAELETHSGETGQSCRKGKVVWEKFSCSSPNSSPFAPHSPPHAPQSAPQCAPQSAPHCSSISPHSSIPPHYSSIASNCSSITPQLLHNRSSLLLNHASLLLTAPQSLHTLDLTPH